jgi:hypothetical protein
MCCQKGSSKSVTTGSLGRATAHGLARCSGYSTCTPPRSSQRLRCPRLHLRGWSRRPLSAVQIAVTRWRCASCFPPRLATHLESMHAASDSPSPKQNCRPELPAAAMRRAIPPSQPRWRYLLAFFPEPPFTASSDSGSQPVSSDCATDKRRIPPSLRPKPPHQPICLIPKLR